MNLKDQILARMYVIITLMAMFPVLVGLQVLRVSAVDGDDLRQVVEIQSSEYRVIPALRGEIFDAAGRPLAVNIERVDIAVDPLEKGFDESSRTFYDRLAQVSGVPASTLKARVRNRVSQRYAMLVRDVRMSADELKWFAAIPGVIPDGSTSRRYNHGTAAAHILGIAGTDGGQAGLELQFDSLLSGLDGQRLLRKDRRNHVKFMPGNEERPPRHGESLVLTIDLIQQSILEEELEKGTIEAGATWGAAVAIDPKTGAILALANWPTFDPNRPGAYSVEARRNHVINDKIEPGSVIKVVPAVAAIEKGLVAMGDSIDTGDGRLQQGRFTITDTHPHGVISFSEAIMVSSNVATAMVAARMTKGLMYQYARQFGFNQKTGIELPGEAVTTLLKPDRWDATTQSAMSRGYAIEASTLQIALAYGALANGGVLMKPYIVAERRDANGQVTWQAEPDSVRRVFDRKTAEILMPAFESVVSEVGTAPLAQVEGLRIAGKTGTARKSNGRGYVGGAYRATFVGFWPVEDPQVVIAIVMDEPRKSMYGGIVAAPVFRNVTERWMARMDELAPFVKEDGARVVPEAPMTIPDVTDLPVPIADRRLQALGLEPRGSNEDFMAAVAEQALAPGTEALQGVPVRLASRVDSLRVMPDLDGLSSREAVAWLNQLGVEALLEGHGTVAQQQPAPGAPLPSRARLALH
ncbi:MAG: penicillin-binding transpeptidase domain-containing protein [Bacteroidetes bacterium]|nr:penicillin-binding transpeptidase domain-containing protein [Bacteroidota bacterium]